MSAGRRAADGGTGSDERVMPMHAVARHYDRLGMKLLAVAEAMSLEDPLVKAAEVDHIVSRLPPGRTRASLLEIGCGYGRLVSHFLARGIRYTGLDINPAYVESCRARFGEDGHFFQADFLARGGPADETFDVVAFPWLVLTHYDFPQQAEMLARAAALLASESRSYVVFDHIPTADIEGGAYSVEARAEGDVLTPHRGEADSELRCYVMNLELARRVAQEGGLALEASTLRLAKVSKTYVFLVSA